MNNNLIICISGFLDKLDQNSGVYSLYQKLVIQNPHDIIILLNWNTKIYKFIKFFNLGYNKITIIGYSYGGNTAALLVKEMNRRGVSVDYLFMIDAVWRRWKRRPSITSLDHTKTIVLTDGVKELFSWRQYYGKILGHEIISGENTIRHDYVVNTNHTNIDSDPAIHEIILSTCKTL